MEEVGEAVGGGGVVVFITLWLVPHTLDGKRAMGASSGTDTMRSSSSLDLKRSQQTTPPPSLHSRPLQQRRPQVNQSNLAHLQQTSPSLPRAQESSASHHYAPSTAVPLPSATFKTGQSFTELNMAQERLSRKLSGGMPGTDRRGEPARSLPRVQLFLREHQGCSPRCFPDSGLKEGERERKKRRPSSKASNSLRPNSKRSWTKS